MYRRVEVGRCRAYSGEVGKFLLVVVVFAVLVYGVFWLIERRGRHASRVVRPRPTTTRRAVAPDDDEEFLRELERRRRRAARERKPETPGPDLTEPEQPSDDERGQGQSSPE